jgi:hypothetical protein
VSSALCSHSATSFAREGAILEVQVAIEQIGDFAGGAWFPNPVQRSQNVFGLNDDSNSEFSSSLVSTVSKN